MASRCADVMPGQVPHRESSLSALLFPGGLPALPFRNLPKSGRLSGKLSGEPGPGPAFLHHWGGGERAGWRAAKAGEQLRVGRAPGRVGRQRGNAGRPIARGHSPAPRDAQNSGSRSGGSSRRVKTKAGAMPASPAPLGRARPASFPPAERPLALPATWARLVPIPHLLRRSPGVTQPPQPREDLFGLTARKRMGALG